jgi:hypothetical protein
VAAADFPLLGFDIDNETVFMDEAVRGYCGADKIEFAWCRACCKNDQVHLEKKKGDIVRMPRGVAHGAPAAISAEATARPGPSAR